MRLPLLLKGISQTVMYFCSVMASLFACCFCVRFSFWVLVGLFLFSFFFIFPGVAFALLLFNPVDIFLLLIVFHLGFVFKIIVVPIISHGSVSNRTVDVVEFHWFGLIITLYYNVPGFLHYLHFLLHFCENLIN